jgi:hypothetical protein
MWKMVPVLEDTDGRGLGIWHATLVDMWAMARRAGPPRLRSDDAARAVS